MMLIECDQLKAFAGSILANLPGEKPVGMIVSQGVRQLCNDCGFADSWKSGQ
jgi:hypothetical protein